MGIRYLNHAALIQCEHGGTVRLFPPAQRSYYIEGHPILTNVDLMKAAIESCSQTGPGRSPCTKIAAILTGKAMQIKVDGETPILKTLQARTNGWPPGMCVAKTDGNSNDETLPRAVYPYLGIHSPHYPYFDATGTPCATAKRNDDQLAREVVDRANRLRNPDNVAAGGPASSFESSICERMAAKMRRIIVPRFNKYRQALPYARAANDVNKLKDEPGRMPKGADCVTRLPDTATELSEALSLQPGVLRDSDLRDDDTGFRAAVYCDESTGRLIVVPRDTEPHSLVDWMTNTRNPMQDTPQYAAMRSLVQKLQQAGMEDFDLAGYSKGGGLVQEGGLLAPTANVYVFNSAGLPDIALSRTGEASFDSLKARTRAFSSDGDFLTFMNQTKDPDEQINNALYLRNQLEGSQSLVNPIDIEYASPSALSAQKDQERAKRQVDEYLDADELPPPEALEQSTRYPEVPLWAEKDNYLAELDKIIAQAKDMRAKGIQLFPPLRSENDPDVVPTRFSELSHLGKQPNLGNLAQHRMGPLLAAMRSQVDEDRKAMEDFLKRCS